MKQPIGGGDAEVVVESGHEIPSTGAASNAVLTALVAGADDSAGLNAATSPKVCEGSRPVITARLHSTLLAAGHAAAATRHARDARSAPELARDTDKHLLVQAALVNILN